MIIVAEGVSAAGKTRWAAQYAPAIVEENTASPAATSDIAAVGRFWSDRHSERWLRGLELERMHGAVCFDTDPLKIHYGWCLWQIGKGTREEWLANVVSTRAHIAQKQLGFADRIAFLEPPEYVVRAQKANDGTRRRSNFETHLQLYAPLRRWYLLQESLAPGRVLFNADQRQEPAPLSLKTDRYCLALFDALIETADQTLGSSQSP